MISICRSGGTGMTAQFGGDSSLFTRVRPEPKQMIRLLFAHPQRLRRIWLNFVEPLAERTQAYALRWSPDGGQSFREIVRQQWNFSRQGATGGHLWARQASPGSSARPEG